METEKEGGESESSECIIYVDIICTRTYIFVRNRQRTNRINMEVFQNLVLSWVSKHRRCEFYTNMLIVHCTDEFLRFHSRGSFEPLCLVTCYDRCCFTCPVVRCLLTLWSSHSLRSQVTASPPRPPSFTWKYEVDFRFVVSNLGFSTHAYCPRRIYHPPSTDMCAIRSEKGVCYWSLVGDIFLNL